MKNKSFMGIAAGLLVVIIVLAVVCIKAVSYTHLEHSGKVLRRRVDRKAFLREIKIGFLFSL